uniref:Uncharacterized protein n=1 Tax=Anguilla anguilla TaxID=7936 RepID=A0A0E9XXK2_ANGAN
MDKLQRVGPCSPQQAKKFTDSIMYMLITDMGYIIPSRSHDYQN